MWSRGREGGGDAEEGPAPRGAEGDGVAAPGGGSGGWGGRGGARRCVRGEAGSLRGWGRGPEVKFKAWPGRFGLRVTVPGIAFGLARW